MTDSEKTSSQIELEIKVTFLEDTLTELNKIVYKQQIAIDELQETIRKLTARIDELEDMSGEDLPHVKPPHY